MARSMCRPPFVTFIVGLSGDQIMSQFVRTSAGVFAAVGSGQHEPSIAERICAAISAKIAEKPQKILQPAWWGECVSMIPGQSPASASSTRSIIDKKTAPFGLANLCSSPAFRATSTGKKLTAGIEGLLAKLPTLQSLNCLSISFAKSGDLQIALAIITADETAAPHISAGTVDVSVDLTETIVSYSSKKVAHDIDELFGSFEALGTTPYYVSVRPNGLEAT